MSSGAELHFSRNAVELPHTEVILTKKDERRCRRHATKMQLRGKFGQDVGSRIAFGDRLEGRPGQGRSTERGARVSLGVNPASQGQHTSDDEASWRLASIL